LRRSFSDRHSRQGGLAMTKGTGRARIIEAVRSQLGWDLVDLDAWLAADHLARVIWAFTGTLDLSAVYSAIKSVEARRAARPSIRAFCWRFGFVRQPKASVRLASLSGFAAAIWPIAGSRAGFR
jgi:hypothetical protein